MLTFASLLKLNLNKMKKVVLSTVAMATLFFISCSKEDVIKEVEGVVEEILTPTISAPDTYTFERNGTSSVSFSGQTTRIKMAEEIIDSFKVTTSTQEKLDKMFGHSEGDNDFSEAELNASSKNVRNKTAASSDYFSGGVEAVNIKEDFDGFIKKQVDEVFPNWEVDAVKGTAGRIKEADGKERFVNAKGLEYDQAFGKGLIGALMVDQILNHYLGTTQLDGGTSKADNDAGTLVEGKNYTNMEHKWDEAYGYLYGTENDPAAPKLGADSFLNKYLQRVDADPDFAGIADEIVNAFKLGRAAIVAKNYELRDQQVEVIREAISKVIAVRAVYYLQSGKEQLAKDDKGAAFHDLSEAYGFIYSLRFTQKASEKNPHLAVDEINKIVADLQEGDGFWTITAEALDEMSKKIATAYGFDVSKAY